MGSTLTVDNIQGATTAANVKLPAGSVVQVQKDVRYGLSSHFFNSNTTSFAATGLEVTITPKFNNSQIMIQCFSSMVEVTGSSADGQAGIYIKVGSGSYAALPASGTGASANLASANYTVGYSHNAYAIYSPWNTYAFYTCTSLDTLKFQPYAKTNSAGTLRFGHSSSCVGIIATEITV